MSYAAPSTFQPNLTEGYGRMRSLFDGEDLAGPIRCMCSHKRPPSATARENIMPFHSSPFFDLAPQTCNIWF